MNHIRIFGLTIATLSCIASHARADSLPKLDGWGPFKFDMSFNDALIASGVNGWIVDIPPDIREIHYSFKLDGASKVARVIYLADHPLLPSAIYLDISNTQGVGQSKCEKDASMLYNNVSNKYPSALKNNEKQVVNDFGSGNKLILYSFQLHFENGAYIETRSTYGAGFPKGTTCSVNVIYVPAPTAQDEHF